MAVNRKMIKSLRRAMDEFPYYEPGLARMVFTVDNEHCMTMGTTAKLKIAYNENYVNELDDDDLGIVLVHEVLHVLRDHHHRWKINKHFKKISPTIANIAMDIEINQVLEDNDHIMKTAYVPKTFDLPKGKSFEFYLDCILQKMDQRKKGYSFDKQEWENDPQNDGNNSQNNGNKGKSKSNSKQQKGNGNGDNDENKDGDNDYGDSIDRRLDDLNAHQQMYENIGKALDRLSKSVNGIDMSDSEGESDSENEQQIQDIIDEIKRKSEGIGKDHSVTDVMRTVPKKVYDWKSVLKSIIKHRSEQISKGLDFYSYSRFDSRTIHPVYVPGHYGKEPKVDLVIGIDVSGSMGDLVDEMYSRLKSIKGQLSEDSNIIVAECDTEISKVSMNFNPMQAEIKSTAGGGTDMNAIPKWVDDQVKKRNIPDPSLIVIMTDNECYWENNNPMKTKTVVLTTNVSKECPYKQYEVTLD